MSHTPTDRLHLAVAVGTKEQLHYLRLTDFLTQGLTMAFQVIVIYDCTVASAALV